MTNMGRGITFAHIFLPNLNYILASYILFVRRNRVSLNVVRVFICKITEIDYRIIKNSFIEKE